MAVKKQIVTFSIVFDEKEIYEESAAEAISHRLFNEEGVIEWDFKVKKEETLQVSNKDFEEEE